MHQKTRHISFKLKVPTSYETIKQQPKRERKRQELKVSILFFEQKVKIESSPLHQKFA